MTRQDERAARAAEAVIVGGLPDFPGIGAAMRLTPDLAVPMRGLANALLVDPFHGSTLTRGDREVIATAVSAANDCFYCMDSHGAFACELLAREGVANGASLVAGVKSGIDDGLGAKIRCLVHIARTVQRRALDVTAADIARAKEAGATDADVQLAVLIASAFCMYNRMVDGLRARTYGAEEAYRARAVEIADHGYGPPPAPGVLP